MTERWPTGIAAITLFVDDLKATTEFYRTVFGPEVHFKDDVSAVFKFGNTLVNLLPTSAAHELIAPVPGGGPDAGARLLTIPVEDLDATCAATSGRSRTRRSRASSCPPPRAGAGAPCR